MAGVPNFYESVMSDGQRDAAKRAPKLTDLSDEVALLRVLIRSQLDDAESVDLIGRSIERLAKVLKTQQSLSGDSGRKLDELLASVLREVGKEMGIGE